MCDKEKEIHLFEGDLVTKSKTIADKMMEQYGDELASMAKRLKEISLETKSSIYLNSTYLELNRFGIKNASVDARIFPYEEHDTEEKTRVLQDVKFEFMNY